jgi:hypothetical protein
VAYRIPNLNSIQAQIARDFAGRQLGRQYNFVGIGGHAARIVFTILHPVAGWIIGRNNLDRASQSFNREDQFFCSQLVLAAFVHAGIRLTATEPSWNTPGDVANLRLRGALEYVGHLKA